MSDSDLSYENLLDMTGAVDCATFRQHFKKITRNAAGIPLHLEDEAERRGTILSETYETFYDSRKAALREAGIQFSQLVRADDGGLVAVNLAACLSIPVFMQALEQGDGPLFAVMVLHWMRSTPEKEWVFSHLCEAVHAYFRCKDLRDQLGDAAEYPFDDLRDHLREALHQFNHRHC